MLVVGEVDERVSAFRTAAERYVAVIDAAGGAPKEELFADLVQVLPVLYETAVRLPMVEPETNAVSDTRFTDEDVAEICHRLQRVLGRDDFYWTVVPFGDDAREEFGGVLQDDLFDIYRDLRDPVDAGVAEAEAVWE